MASRPDAGVNASSLGGGNKPPALRTIQKKASADISTNASFNKEEHLSKERIRERAKKTKQIRTSPGSEDSKA